MESEQKTAKKLYPIAAVCLGSFREARAAVIEAIAAAERKKPDQPEQEALSQLLRICQSRAPEKLAEHDFPEGSPLLPLLKLTASGRRNLVLHLSDYDDAEAAAVRQITAEEFEQKTEKALRQMTFLQGGQQPDPEALRAALHMLSWSEADEAALREGLQSARAQEAEQQESRNIRDITQKKQPEEKRARTVTVPLWTIIAGGLCILALCVSMVLSAVLRHRDEPEPALPAGADSHSVYEPGEFDRMVERILSLEAVQQRAAEAAGLAPEDAVFLSTKLKLNAEPVCYELDFLGRNGQEYSYKLHAESGAVLEQQQFKADNELNTEGWIPAADMRQRVLKTANMQTALFLKEKCSSEDQLGVYKYELTDARGKLFTVQLEAKTGALIKYSVEDPQTDNPTDVISAEEAKKKAVSRVGDYKPEDVIFTKTKFDGNVYLIAFTLDDGTQYTIELNANDGMTNTVDVHPVSADTSKAIGLLRAREIVLAKAGLTGDQTVTFTKAKIDRNNGAYVYELEFETPGYEYEVNLNIETGEMLKYRAWSLT
ncbi:MAG: PepSY domain-containing protein [Oscillospiraceae bacterium]|nr:PepSY domain-containing protein [Oscillospiraceae bacterium]